MYCMRSDINNSFFLLQKYFLCFAIFVQFWFKKIRIFSDQNQLRRIPKTQNPHDKNGGNLIKTQEFCELEWYTPENFASFAHGSVGSSSQKWVVTYILYSKVCIMEILTAPDRFGSASRRASRIPAEGWPEWRAIPPPFLSIPSRREWAGQGLRQQPKKGSGLRFVNRSWEV